MTNLGFDLSTIESCKEPVSLNLDTYKLSLLETQSIVRKTANKQLLSIPICFYLDKNKDVNNFTLMSYKDSYELDLSSCDPLTFNKAVQYMSKKYSKRSIKDIDFSNTLLLLASLSDDMIRYILDTRNKTSLSQELSKWVYPDMPMLLFLNTVVIRDRDSNEKSTLYRLFNTRILLLVNVLVHSNLGIVENVQSLKKYRQSIKVTKLKVYNFKPLIS